MDTQRLHPRAGDALVLVDVQNDFLPGGALGIPAGDAILVPLNRCVEEFERLDLPIFATRDWHPAGHCSFLEQGGPWPVHCVAGTWGAQLSSGLALSPRVRIVSKGTQLRMDAYSAFQGTDLAARLRDAGCGRLFVGGLATDYCVLATVKDALAENFAVIVLADAVAAVNAQPEDGSRALQRMTVSGAQVVPAERVLG
jgi:nicotinamidase-related amidase